MIGPSAARSEGVQNVRANGSSGPDRRWTLFPGGSSDGQGPLRRAFPSFVRTAGQDRSQVSPDSSFQRWVQWRPTGAEPGLAELDEWMRKVRPFLNTASALSAAGHATKNEVVREMVEIAVKSHKSSAWPAGRSVTITDIRATISDDKRARELHKHLVRLGGRVGVVLGDLCKDVIDGRARVDQRVVKVPNPWTESTYYDTPMLDGFESRRLVVPMRGLATVFSSATVHDLNLERSAALAMRGMDPVLDAIVALRILHVQHELDRIGEQVVSVRQAAALLSKTESDRLDEMIARYNRLRAGHGTTAEALADAGEALAPFSIDPAEVLAVDRPLLTGSEYAAWFPASALRGRTAPEFLARAKSLKRYPTPAFTGRTDPDPVRASPTGVDRVDALVYAAQQRHTPMAGFLLGGSALLGRFLRDARLPALLLESGDLHLRHQALAALALLGDERACTVARAALDGAEHWVRKSDAIFALMVLRRFRAGMIPGPERRAADLPLLRLTVLAEQAATGGRWLLQR